MLDKKANSSDFLNEFKMGHKAAETTHIHKASGPETANEGTAQWRLKLCKGAESLHDKECSGRPLEAEGDPLTATAEDGPL